MQGARNKRSYDGMDRTHRANNSFKHPVYSFDKALYVGNIQFPQSIQNTPQMAVYRGGIKIKTETDEASKNIQFTVSDDKSCKTFYILITQDIQPYIQEHTVQYLKTDPKQDYKFYRIDLIENKAEQPDEDTYKWNIKDETIPTDGRIPDSTIIIIFDPSFVDKIEGGTKLELPKVIMKQNIVEIAGGSEEMLHDKTIQMLMSSLDLNLIHTRLTPEIKQNHKKKLVIAMANPES